MLPFVPCPCRTYRQRPAIPRRREDSSRLPAVRTRYSSPSKSLRRGGLISRHVLGDVWTSHFDLKRPSWLPSTYDNSRLPQITGQAHACACARSCDQICGVDNDIFRVLRCCNHCVHQVCTYSISQNELVVGVGGHTQHVVEWLAFR